MDDTTQLGALTGTPAPIQPVGETVTLRCLLCGEQLVADGREAALAALTDHRCRR